MNRKIIICLLFFVWSIVSAWGQNWITSPEQEVNAPNTWIAFRRDVQIDKLPSEVVAQIAVDSKYWLWINGELAVFEGGLKRGPNPRDTYSDEVNIAPYLKKWNNKIAVLDWYFGKNGFSHKSSDRAGLMFAIKDKKIALNSDAEWLCRIHPAYGNTGELYSNFRLPESNVHFNAAHDMIGWQTEDCKNFGFYKAKEIGAIGSAPWNKLVKRPIPFWKDFGIKTA